MREVLVLENQSCSFKNRKCLSWKIEETAEALPGAISQALKSWNLLDLKDSSQTFNNFQDFSLGLVGLPQTPSAPQPSVTIAFIQLLPRHVLRSRIRKGTDLSQIQASRHLTGRDRNIKGHVEDSAALDLWDLFCYAPIWISSRTSSRIPPSSDGRVHEEKHLQQNSAMQKKTNN